MSTSQIHPTATVHPEARVGPSCVIGPGAVIEAHVELGEGCEVGPWVQIAGWTRVGRRNRFHAGAVIGDLPQDLRFKGGETWLEIGDDNIFREHVTIHRSNKPGEPTRVGNHCFLMANSHVGHNSALGNGVILANGALVAGHVEIGDKAFISGNCLIHQFVRVGQLALMQGGAGVSKDLPPFTIARGDNHIAGLNTIGLRRAGIGSAERLELRRLYHFLFRSRQGRLHERLEIARGSFPSASSQHLIHFASTAKRGLCEDSSRRAPVAEPEEE